MCSTIQMNPLASGAGHCVRWCVGCVTGGRARGRPAAEIYSRPAGALHKRKVFEAKGISSWPVSRAGASWRRRPRRLLSGGAGADATGAVTSAMCARGAPLRSNWVNSASRKGARGDRFRIRPDPNANCDSRPAEKVTRIRRGSRRRIRGRPLVRPAGRRPPHYVNGGDTRSRAQVIGTDRPYLPAGQSPRPAKFNARPRLNPIARPFGRTPRGRRGRARKCTGRDRRRTGSGCCAARGHGPSVSLSNAPRPARATSAQLARTTVAHFL